ncbi:IS66 family transposase, partial [Paraburkholderia sp. BR13439]
GRSHPIADSKGQRHRSIAASSLATGGSHPLVQFVKTGLLAAYIEAELEQLQPQAAAEPLPQQPKRAALPAQLPRTEIRHEPQST